jgi:hypothetical protein
MFTDVNAFLHQGVLLTNYVVFATVKLQHPVLAQASAGLFDWSTYESSS